MKDIKELTELYKRYLADECTADEEEELFSSLISGQHRELFLQLIQDTLDNNDSDTNQRDIMRVLQHARTNIGERIGSQPIHSGKKHRIWLRIVRIAAVILCVFTVTFFFFRINRQPESGRRTSAKVHRIQPGGNKAILTLADGSEISLTDAGHGTLATQQGVSVTKSADGQIIYKAEESRDGNFGAAHAAPPLNTITTPRGGQYTVILPDGTKVWLNAATSLKYPIKFSGKERKVVLQGEAYFEVTRLSNGANKGENVPFVVVTGNQEVEVLGTHFNINGYTDEPVVKTTLLEGKVRVNRDGEGNVILIPGQQSQTSSARKDIRVTNADIKAELAWKNNQFFFEDEPVEMIMRQIARWYDVEVIYRDDLKNKTVWGSVTRFSDLSKVLNILQLTGNIHFKIEGRQVFVMK